MLRFITSLQIFKSPCFVIQWHIYRKWNERLFLETYKAFSEGRAEKDPTPGWYQGEIGCVFVIISHCRESSALVFVLTFRHRYVSRFFDFYVIPLAKKLKDCGVFVKSSDEYLNYAVSNRNEWEQRGRTLVEEMKIKAFAYVESEKRSNYFSSNAMLGATGRCSI
jgi:hypothetical protein